MSDPGRVFERQILASLPRWPHLHGRIVPDHPAAFIADRQGAEGARFVRPNPWDIEIRWLTRGRYAEHGRGEYVPSEHFEVLAECKSTQEPRLPFSALKSRRHPKTGKEILWQERELLAVADAGAFAGVLWEWRRPGQDWLAVWVPIRTWAMYRRAGLRKSLSWAEAISNAGHRDGCFLIQSDTERMRRARTRTYYNLAPLLAHLAGGVPQP